MTDKETEGYLEDAPLEVLMCRSDLRHSWPRPKRMPSARRLPASGPIRFETVEQHRDGRPIRVRRLMDCAGGCGTVRRDLFDIVWVDGEGTFERIGHAHLRYAKHYKRQRIDKDVPLERIDPGVIRGRLVGRLYPKLVW